MGNVHLQHPLPVQETGTLGDNCFLWLLCTIHEVSLADYRLIHICLSAKQMRLRSFNSLLFKQLERLSSVSSALSKGQEVTLKCPEVLRWRQFVVH